MKQIFNIPEIASIIPEYKIGNKVTISRTVNYEEEMLVSSTTSSIINMVNRSLGKQFVVIKNLYTRSSYRNLILLEGNFDDTYVSQYWVFLASFEDPEKLCKKYKLKLYFPKWKKIDWNR